MMWYLIKLGASSIFGDALAFKTGMKIKVPWLAGTEINGWYNGEKFQFGASLNYVNGNGTVFAGGKGGNLSFSGAVSLLNNPLVSSTVSPFFKAQKNPSLFSASIPDGSSFSKPLSLFAFSSFPLWGSSSDKIVVSGAVSEENEWLLSLNYKRKEKRQGIDFQFILKTNPVFQNPNESWYLSKNIYIEETLKISSLFQESLNFKGVSFLLSQILYLDFYGNLLPVFRIESSWKNINALLSVNPLPDVVSASGKELERCISLKVNYQNQRRLNQSKPVLLKYGATVYNKISLENKDFDLRGVAGFRLFSVRTSIGGNIYGNMLSEQEGLDFKVPRLTRVGVNLNNSYYMDKLSPSLKGSLSVVPQNSNSGQDFKTNENFSLILNTGANPYVNLSLAAGFSGLNFQCSKREIDLGITSKYKNRFFDISGKISMSLEF